MTDRTYLPYQSARDFQDRGMAKWTGFFLSEHSTALAKKELDMSQLTQLDRQEINQLLRQAYSQQVPIQITFLNQDKLTDITAQSPIWTANRSSCRMVTITKALLSIRFFRYKP